MKKVLLMVIDACSSRVIIPAMNAGKLPGFRKLEEHGILRPRCTSVFPSITPAATSSIATGVYPQEHGIIGAFWYDKSHDEVAYYGDDFWVILKRGLSDFFKDFLVNLNEQRLDTKTIFERVERAGMRAASLNYMIFHSIFEHRTELPFWMSLMPGIESGQRLMGPSIMLLGDFVSTELHKSNIEVGADGGPFKRFGFQDAFTGSELLELAHARCLPELTLAYFPDNDYQSHEQGPQNALFVLEAIDTTLMQLFDLYGGADQFFSEFCLIITGDHSQSEVTDDESGLIAIDDILSDFPLATPGESWDTGERIMICPNLRTAQLYFRKPGRKQLESVIERLLCDERIDQVIWRENLFDHRSVGFHIATAGHGELHFQSGRNGNSYEDEYGGKWSWEGNLATIGGIPDGKHIFFEDYPNAFERIAGGLGSENSGQLWITAKPGYECGFSGDGFHQAGGSHGTLHSLDSTAPLFVGGLPDGISIPKTPRIVDIAGIISRILGLPCAHQVGASHVRQEN